MTEFTPEMMEAMQRLAAPGAAHGRLADLTGTWDTETRMYMAPGADPIVTTGRAEARMILGDRFLVEDLDGKGPTGEPYRGQSLVGFNNLKQRFEGIWVSDGMTPMTTYTGELDENGSTVVYTGTETDPSGQGPDRSFCMERAFHGPDRNTLTMKYEMPDGTWMTSFEIEYARRGEAE